MSDAGVPLPGGKLNQVVRVGNTVRRVAGPWTPTIHALLHHVRANGFRFAPEPLGLDDTGREVLEYIPGETVGEDFPWPSWARNDDLLAQVGRATAEYHEAVADFDPPEPVIWQGPPRSGSTLVCHHDLAPYNVVIRDGDLVAFIDWDLAGPGSVRSELAFIAWQWIPLLNPAHIRGFGWDQPPDVGRRLRILLDAYGLEDRTNFIDDVIARVVLQYHGILARAAEGISGYVHIVQEGHVDFMIETEEYLRSARDSLQSSITS